MKLLDLVARIAKGSTKGLSFDEVGRKEYKKDGKGPW